MRDCTVQYCVVHSNGPVGHQHLSATPVAPNAPLPPWQGCCQQLAHFGPLPCVGVWRALGQEVRLTNSRVAWYAYGHKQKKSSTLYWQPGCTVIGCTRDIQACSTVNYNQRHRSAAETAGCGNRVLSMELANVPAASPTTDGPACTRAQTQTYRQ